MLAHTLIDIDPQYPTVDADAVRDLGDARQELEAEAPDGAAPDPFAAAHDGAPTVERPRPWQASSVRRREARTSADTTA